MTFGYKLIGWTGLVVVLTTAMPSGQVRQQSNVVRLRQTSVTPRETTLASRIAAVDAVVRVRVTAPATQRAVDISANVQRRRPGRIGRSSQFVTPITEYSGLVTEVIKPYGTAVVGTEVRFGILGGRGNLNGTEYVLDRRSEELRVDGSYIVLLKYAPDYEMLMFFDEDVYRVDTSRVTSNIYAGETEYGKTLIGRTPDEFMEEIRQAAVPQQ